MSVLKDLQYALTVGLVDKLTGPAKRVGLGTKTLTKNLYATKTALKETNQQAKQVTQLQEFDKRMGSMATETGKARTRLAALHKEFNNAKSAGKATKRLQQSIGATTTKIKKLTSSHAELKTQSNQTRQALRAQGLDTRNLGATQQSLIDKTKRLNSELGEQRDKLSAVHKMGERLSSFWKKTKTTAIAGGIAIAGAMAPMVATAATFEQSMSHVGALSGAYADPKQMQALTDTARKLGATTSFSAIEVAEGMKYLATAGFDTNKIIASMPGVLNLAKAGALELGQAADISSDILSGFGLEADKMGRVGDVLTKTFTSSNTTLHMLGEAMSYSAPVARQFGISIEQVSAMAGLLANVGIKGSTAGTTLRAMMLRLAAPTNIVAEKLKIMGVETRDSSGNMLDIINIMESLNNATKQLGSGQRLAFLKDVFGEEPAAGMAELLEKSGGKMRAYADQMYKVDGIAKEIATQMGNNTSGATKEWQSALESLSITVGNVFLPPLTKLIKKGTELVRMFESLAKENPQLIENIIYGAMAFGGLVAVVGTLGFALPGIISGLGLIKGAVMLLSKAMLTNPIGLAVAAIATAAIYIWENWETLEPKFKALWQRIVTEFKALPATFKKIGNNIMDGITGGIDKGWSKIKNKMNALGDMMPDWLKKRLDIHSPSRVMAKIGGNIAEGVGVGIQQKTPHAIGAMRGLAKRLTGPMPALVMGGAIAAGGANPAMATGDIHIHVYPHPNQNAVEISQEVARQLETMKREMDSRNRSKLRD